MGVEGTRRGMMTQSDRELWKWFGTTEEHIVREKTMRLDVLQGEKGRVGVVEISMLTEEINLLSLSSEVRSLYPITVTLWQPENGMIDVYIIDRRRMYGSELLSHTQSVPGEMPKKVPRVGELAKYKDVISGLLEESWLGKIPKDRVYDVLCYVKDNVS